MIETTYVETDVTKYDMDNHGPYISIEEDVKLTGNVNYAFDTINLKEIDAPAKRSMFALSGCSNVEKCPVCLAKSELYQSLPNQLLANPGRLICWNVKLTDDVNHAFNCLYCIVDVSDAFYKFVGIYRWSIKVFCIVD